MHFHVWKFLYFDLNFTELYFWGCNWQVHIGLDNGLVLNRWPAIIWTNDDLVYWRIYASHDLNDLTVLCAWICFIHKYSSMGYLNVKMPSYQHGISHCKVNVTTIFLCVKMTYSQISSRGHLVIKIKICLTSIGFSISHKRCNGHFIFIMVVPVPWKTDSLSYWNGAQGTISIWRFRLISKGITIIRIKLSCKHFIFMMWILIHWRQSFISWDHLNIKCHLTGMLITHCK